MHPRNIYKVPPDFSKLAIRYPEFLKISSIDLNGTVRINFKDPQTLLVLTRCLLHADFGLEVDIPPDRLVPTIPLRLNYLLWLQDILEEAGRKDDISGIDIGTGACCIYPLLAATKMKWKMLATEIDENSVNMALKNIKQNKLENSISVKKVENNSQLLMHCFKIYRGSLDIADFCMCNPPFYSSIDDMDFARSAERPPPRSARTGSLQEIVTEGGEVTFVTKLIRESLILKDKIRIYTTMLGHKSSLKPLLRILKELSINQVSHTTFTQGRTTRWGLAWSFLQASNLTKCSPPAKASTKNKCMSFVVPSISGVDYKVKDITLKLLHIFKELQLRCKLLQQKDVISTLELKAFKNTWSNQRKLRRELKLKKQNEAEHNGSDERLKHGCTENSNILVQNCTNNLEIKTGHLNLKRKIDSSMDNLEVDSKRKTNKDDLSFCDSRKDNLGTKSECLIPNVNYTGIDNVISDKCDNATLEIISTQNCIRETEASCSQSQNPDYLTAAVCVRINDGYIVFEIGYVSGSAGRDGVHQIVQYIKNNWK